MTFEQLTIFVAVAERQHLTRAAAALRLTPSAVSSAIKALEGFYNVALFARVGRGIELTQAGRLFLVEAKATLARAQQAALVLSELGGLKRGTLAIHASQTVASYWLPRLLMRFHETFPHIALPLTVGNTRSVTEAVLAGAAELGFVEGEIDEPALTLTRVARDDMVVVISASHPLAGEAGAGERLLREASWVMREEGSGTRAMFAAALAARGLDIASLAVAFTLPSNEAILSALSGSRAAAAISRMAAAPLLHSGELVVADLTLPPRDFLALHHKQRAQSKAAEAFLRLCVGGGSPSAFV